MKSYTFKMLAPKVELAKVDDNKFKVTITNLDDDNKLYFNKIKYRVRTKTADADFEGNVCLIDDNHLRFCEGSGDAKVGKLAIHEFKDSDNSDIIINVDEEGTKTYYILVDGENIEPDVLRAEVLVLNYGHKNSAGALAEENYDVVAE